MLECQNETQIKEEKKGIKTNSEVINGLVKKIILPNVVNLRGRCFRPFENREGMMNRPDLTYSNVEPPDRHIERFHFYSRKPQSQFLTAASTVLMVFYLHDKRVLIERSVNHTEYKQNEGWRLQLTPTSQVSALKALDIVWLGSIRFLVGGGVKVV